MKEKTLRNLAIYGTGNSSEGILKKHLGIDDVYTTPADSDDLIRCITIVDLTGIDIEIMRGTSTAWDNILDQWDTLLELANDRKNDELIFRVLKVMRDKR